LNNSILTRNTIKGIDWLAAAFMAIVALFLPSKWSIIWVNGKTFLATIVLGVMAMLLLKKKQKISFNWFHLLLFFSTMLALLSGFWAFNSSLVFKDAVTWLFLLVLAVVTQMYVSNGVNLKFLTKAISMIYLFNFIALVGALFYANLIDSPEQSFYQNIRNLSRYFHYNGNYVSAFLVMFYPLVFFGQNSVFQKKMWKMIIGTVVALTIVLLNSRASTLTLVVIMAMHVLAQLKTITLKRTIIFLGILVAAAIVLPLIDASFWKMYNPLFGLDGGNDRLILWENTWQIVKQNPVLGVGSGNWVIVFPTTDTGFLNSMIDKYNYYIHPHNLYLHLLSERGFLGLLLFIALIVFSMVTAFRKKMFRAHYLLIAMVVAFLVLSFFYGVTYSLKVDIPSTQIGFVVALALLSMLGNKNRISISNRIAKLSFSAAFSVLLLWGGFSAYNYTYYTYAKKNKKAIGNERRIKINDQLYSKRFFTVYEAKSVLQTKIDYLIRKKKFDEAIAILHIALNDHPNSAELHYTQGVCFLKMGDLDEAATSFETSLKFHSKLYKSHFQQAFIAFKENDLEAFYEMKSEMAAVYEIMEKLEVYDGLEENRKATQYYKRFKGYLNRMEKLERDLIKNQKGK